MGKENIVIEETSEIQEVLEKLKSLASRVDLIEIILKKEASKPQPEFQSESQLDTGIGRKKVTQINVGNKTYFCVTPEEERIFSENNPGAKMETFKIELLASTAHERLNDPENKKQFIRKNEETLCQTQ